MNTKIKDYISTLTIETITDQRKAVLQPLIDFIKDKKATKQPININFICTHNSRRSHLSQIWAQVMADYFKINQVACYSGGTEATALFPKVADTLAKTGFDIKIIAESNNPVYSIKFDDNSLPIIGFSKTYDDTFNPTSNFAAIMTCSQADSGCPFIAGAEKRIPITFEDPKAYDNKELQDEKYLERSTQIATEMKYIFNKAIA